MPTYVYECDRGHEFEIEQSITDEPLTTCEEYVEAHSSDVGAWGGPCGAPCNRLISQTSFILKGSGWANSGYSKKE